MLTTTALFMLVLGPVFAFAISALVFSTARHVLNQT